MDKWLSKERNGKGDRALIGKLRGKKEEGHVVSIHSNLIVLPKANHPTKSSGTLWNVREMGECYEIGKSRYGYMKC